MLNVDALAQRIVDLIVTRERRDGKPYGTVVLAEGLAENLPSSVLEGAQTDDHGHIALAT